MHVTFATYWHSQRANQKLSNRITTTIWLHSTGRLNRGKRRLRSRCALRWPGSGRRTAMCARVRR